jgi:hypothetical protein
LDTHQKIKATGASTSRIYAAWEDSSYDEAERSVKTILWPFTKSGPRKDKRRVDLISDLLPFGRLWYTKASDAVDYARFYSRSHDAVIRFYDDAGNVTPSAKVERERTHSVKNLGARWLSSFSPARPLLLLLPLNGGQR